MGDPHEQRVVRFLSSPTAYPHPAQSIVRRETHVSHVFLAGQFAYKLKKPVKFPFLDASTVALRKKFCHLELSLNRRLAPTIYLSMVPITERGGQLQLGGRGRVVEWVVKMRRLPEERMLDQLIVARPLDSVPGFGRGGLARDVAPVGAPQVSRKQMQEIADRLIRFFRRAARSRTIARYGTPAQVKALVLGNLQECQPFLGTLLKEPERALLEASYRQFLALHEPVLARRVRERRIIDGHGDLRCENICMWSPAGRHPERPPPPAGGVEGTDRVCIFDCVEFQPAFRCGDLANDFSFLVMDVEFRGRHDLAQALLDRYRRRVTDPTFETVLPFYKCHRSLVRGKVRGFAWLQHPNTPEGRRIRGLSRRHFQLATCYARVFAPPRLILVGGKIAGVSGAIFGGLVAPILTYFAVEMKMGFALPMMIGTTVSLISFIIAILLGPETRGKLLTADLELAGKPKPA